MKRALFACALLVGLGLLAAPAAAQVGQVRGRVVGPQGEPIPDATVLIEYQGGVTRKYEIKTSKKGEYIQVGLDPGPYRITATKEGYRGAVADIRAALGETTQVPDMELLTPEAAAQQPGSEAAQLREKFAEAVSLTNSGKLDEAEAAFNGLLEMHSDVPEIHQNLGFIHAKRKDWAAAEQAYLKALELRPGDSGITSALAKIYQDSGQEEKAMELVSRAAGENPEDAGAQFTRAVYLMNSGQAPEAIAAFEATLALDPGMAEAHYYLGTLLVGQGKVPEAVEHLETYVSLNPDNAQNVATAKGLIEALKK